MCLLDKLFKKNEISTQKAENCTATEAKEYPAISATKEEHNEPYLTETVVFGMHLYRSPGDDSSVYFVDEKRGIRKMLVDSMGNIQNFPGIVKEDFWTREVTARAMEPQIRFRTSFEKRENSWIMLWQIQPDGMYWADEGRFGIEDDAEVTLYTYVNMDGNFTGPFRLYRFGIRPYTLDRFESAPARWYTEYFQKLREGNLETTYSQKPEDLLFPCLRDTPKCYNERNSYVFWSREEAMAYWNHPVLSKILLEATEILLNLDKPISEVGGYGCQYKIRACMTLFWLLTEDMRFKTALDKFFDGEMDKATLEILG